jgi:hypothetical protein
MKRHRIFEIISASLAFLGTVAVAGTVDDYFGKGILGLTWSATLPEVQEKYPGGLTYPAEDEHARSYVMYHVSMESKALGIELPASLAMFEFTKSGKLRAIFFHFSYADRDTVLYRVAEALGQDYSVRDYESEYVYRWKPGRTSAVALNIGQGPPHGWVFLRVNANGDDSG